MRNEIESYAAVCGLLDRKQTNSLAEGKYVAYFLKDAPAYGPRELVYGLVEDHGYVAHAKAYPEHPVETVMLPMELDDRHYAIAVAAAKELGVPLYVYSAR